MDVLPAVQDQQHIPGLSAAVEHGDVVKPGGILDLNGRVIPSQIGAELFQLEPVRAYSKSYNTCIAEAQADQRRDARPKLKRYPESLDGYDTIYLGFPNYWGTMPMCVFTFLERFDFTGKTICPFCTHEGSGMGRSEADIKRLCPGADVKKASPSTAEASKMRKRTWKNG